ncbi:Uncharacterised protein [Chlamydia trachomatis]|nr:Uncharacterised protein [Chlamydia trachomatis]
MPIAVNNAAQGKDEEVYEQDDLPDSISSLLIYDDP